MEYLFTPTDIGFAVDEFGNYKKDGRVSLKETLTFKNTN